MIATLPLHLMQRACKHRKKIWVAADDDVVRIKPMYFAIWFGDLKVAFQPGRTTILGTKETMLIPSCGDGL